MRKSKFTDGKARLPSIPLRLDLAYQIFATNRYQYWHLLQMASQIWRIDCLKDIPNARAQRGEPVTQEDDQKEKLKAEIVSKVLKKVVRPSRSKKMMIETVKERCICIRVSLKSVVLAAATSACSRQRMNKLQRCWSSSRTTTSIGALAFAACICAT